MSDRPQHTDPAAMRPASPKPPPRTREPDRPGFSFARRILPPSGNYHWVLLWELPLRTMHWVSVACIAVLAVTGFYIGKPYFLTGGEASSHFLMGKVRLLHFTAAALLVATALVRTYWLFAGNRFERLAALFPLRPRDWVNMVKQVKFYLMIGHDEEVPHYLGHNPIQQLSYTGLYFVAALTIATGFTLYGQSAPQGFFYTVTAWVPHVFGGLQRVRFIHHVSTWVFLAFVPIHVYLAMRADVLERTGTISSIISGGRFVRSDITYVDE